MEGSLLLDWAILQNMGQSLSKEQQLRVREGWGRELADLQARRQEEEASLRQMVMNASESISTWLGNQPSGESGASNPGDAVAFAIDPSSLGPLDPKVLEKAPLLADLVQMLKALEPELHRLAETTLKVDVVMAKQKHWLTTSVLDIAEAEQMGTKWDVDMEESKHQPTQSACQQLIRAYAAMVGVLLYAGYALHQSHRCSDEAALCANKVVELLPAAPEKQDDSKALWQLLITVNSSLLALSIDDCIAEDFQELAIMAFQARLLKAEVTLECADADYGKVVQDLLSGLPWAAAAVGQANYLGRPTSAQLEGAFAATCCTVIQHMRAAGQGHLCNTLGHVALEGTKVEAGLRAQLCSQMAHSMLGQSRWQEAAVLVAQALPLQLPESPSYAWTLRLYLLSLTAGRCHEGQRDAQGDLAKVVVEYAFHPGAPLLERIRVMAFLAAGAEESIMETVIECSGRLLRAACQSEEESKAARIAAQLLARVALLPQRGQVAAIAASNLLDDGGIVRHKAVADVAAVVLWHLGRAGEARALLNEEVLRESLEPQLEVIRLLSCVQLEEPETALATQLQRTLLVLGRSCPSADALAKSMASVVQEFAKLSRSTCSIACINAFLRHMIAVASKEPVGSLDSDGTLQQSILKVTDIAWQMVHGVADGVSMQVSAALLHTVHSMLLHLPAALACDRLAQCVLRLAQLALSRPMGVDGYNIYFEHIEQALHALKQKKQDNLHGGGCAGPDAGRRQLQLALARARLQLALRLRAGQEDAPPRLLGKLQSAAEEVSGKEVGAFMHAYVNRVLPGQRRLQSLEEVLSEVGFREQVPVEDVHALGTAARCNGLRLARHGGSDAQRWLDVGDALLATPK